MIHRSPLPPRDVIVHDGIPVTSHARTVCDIAHVLDGREVTRAVRQLQFIRRFDLAAVQETLERRPSRVLSDLIADFVAAESYVEDDLLSLCDRYGIPRPLTQRRVDGHRVDFIWPRQRVVVEVDGWDAHSTRTAFQHDRALSNAMLGDGFLVLRFTGADVMRRQRQTARQVLRALRDGQRTS